MRGIFSPGIERTATVDEEANAAEIGTSATATASAAQRCALRTSACRQLRLRADLGEDALEPGLGLVVHERHRRGDRGVDFGDLRVQLVRDRAVAGVSFAPGAELDQMHRLA